MTFEVTQAEPVINEIILIRMIQYFVYEGRGLGLLYFYDEELVDVDEEDENGNVADSHKEENHSETS